VTNDVITKLKDSRRMYKTKVARFILLRSSD